MKLVRVYYNSHKKCFSIQTKTEGRWRLAFHTEELTLVDAAFKVYEHGRQRVLKTRRKAVHAFVLGKLDTPKPLDRALKVRYNPFISGHFVTEDGKAVKDAKYVNLTKSGVFVASPQEDRYEGTC